MTTPCAPIVALHLLHLLNRIKCNHDKMENEDSQLSQRPTELMDPMAWKAARECSMGRPSRKASAVMAHTAFVGVRVRRFTAAQTRYKGTPPSRENDHSILDKYQQTVRKVRPKFLVS